MNALSSASRGMQQAWSQLEVHAGHLASMAAGAPLDPAADVVGSMQASAAFQANVQSLRRSNDALGSLLDRWA